MAEQLGNVLAALERLERAMGQELEQRRRRRRRHYVRLEHLPFLGNRMQTFEEYLAVADPDHFMELTRLRPNEFLALYDLIARHVAHPITPHRSPIPGMLRLFTYLRFVGQGHSFTALGQDLHCGRSTVGEIVYEVARAISKVVYREAFPPLTRGDLENIALRTQEGYDYPRGVGFLDGKHIYIKKPPHSGSMYWCYKKRFSIILLALTDCDRHILTFDVGTPGSAGDADAFRRSGIKRLFDNHDELFPRTRELGDVGPVQYHVLVDCGFAQRYRYIRPYRQADANTVSRRRFNRRHSSARQQVEGTFGQMRGRWRILGTTMDLRPEQAMKLVASLVVLNNWVTRRRNPEEQQARHPAPAQEEETRHDVDVMRSDLAGDLARERLRIYYDRRYGAPRQA